LFSSACNMFPSNFPGGTEPICNFVYNNL
jgi:hypothetical protein